MTNETKPAAKQRSNSAYVFSTQDGKMVWDYPGIGRLEFDPSKASATNRARAQMYGWKQRINDTAALNAGPDGKVSPEAKYEEMRKMIAHYEAGGEEWAVKASEGSGPASYVTRALVSLGTYQGHDVSTPELANAFVRRVADAPKLQLGGQVGKARTWLETHSKIIRDAVAAVRAVEASTLDGDAEVAKIMREAIAVVRAADASAVADLFN